MNVSKDMSAQYTADQIVSLVSDALDDDDFMVVMMMKLSAILRLRLVRLFKHPGQRLYCRLPVKEIAYFYATLPISTSPLTIG